MTRHRLRRSLAAAAVTAAAGASAVATSGCGASNAVDPVAQAATVSTVTPGYTMGMTMQLSSPLLTTPIAGSGSGRFDVPTRSGAFTFTVALPDMPQVRQMLGGSGFTVHEIIQGATVYVQMPAALARRAAAGKPWMKVDLDTGSGAMPGGLNAFGGSFTTDPSQILQYLRAVSGGVTTVGSDTVAGVATTHYRTTVDLDKVAAQAPAANRAAAARSVHGLEQLTGLRRLPMDVWIDGRHLVRKLTSHVGVTVQSVPLTMDLALTFPSYGRQAPATPPPASEVQSVPHPPRAPQPAAGAGTPTA